jgi:Domain of unknown function (DUF4382)
MKKIPACASAIFALALWACTDDGGLKGSLTISITDSPVDADSVSSVNLYITNIEGNVGGSWKSLRSFDQAAGIDLLSYSGGNSYTLVDSYIDPGSFSQLRLSLNFANLTSNLILSPQCNVAFINGRTKPIYYVDPTTSVIIITQGMNVTARGITDYTFDIDVRKSLTVDSQGNFIFNPVIRGVATALTGQIQGVISNYSATSRLVAYAYTSGSYADSEATAPGPGKVMFPNAITAFKVNQGKFGLGFLEAGTYDVIYASNSSNGTFIKVVGKSTGVIVKAKEITSLTVDSLGGS